MTSDLFSSIAQLYEKMDTAWNAAAQNYDFQCNGCKDNCCKSLFFHHTHVEKDFLLFGLSKLDQETQQNIKILAEKYYNKTFNHTDTIESQKIMCPANKDGLCRLYEYRPMICRLHGIPHELNRPGHKPMMGPGCDTGNFDNQPYTPFDRTPFYREMAQIEIEYQFLARRKGKVKQSVAQILLAEIL